MRSRGYLPGLAMRRIADLHAGEVKTDTRAPAIIAQAARSLQHVLRSLQQADEQVPELSMLCGIYQVKAQFQTRLRPMAEPRDPPEPEIL